MERNNESVEMAQELSIGALYDQMRAFAAELAKWDGEEVQSTVIAEIARHQLTPESRAQLIFILLATGHSMAGANALDVNLAGKQFAALLAETMGPDWAQWLYAFTKYVTRLA